MSANLSRRGLLAGIAATPIAALPVAVEASADIEENPALIDAWEQFRKAETEYYAAKDALAWLADEWRHAWPRAPRSAQWFGSGAEPEKDLAGKYFRDDRGQAIYLKTPEAVEDYRQWAKDGPRPLRKNASDKEKLRRQKWFKDLQREVEEIDAYFAEIKRVRAAAGADAADERKKAARYNFDRLAGVVSHEPAKTSAGLRLKADAVIGLMVSYKLDLYSDGFICDALRLAESVMSLTAHLDEGSEA